MRLIFDYDTLTKNLADVAEVVEDNALTDDMRNVIIAVHNEEVSLIGDTNLIMFVRKVAEDKVIVEGGEDSRVNPIYIQIKSKELNNFLHTYKGLRYTEIEELSFEVKDNNTVLCTVLEGVKAKEADDEEAIQNGARYQSSWSFANIPLNAHKEKSISRAIPTMELKEIQTKDLTLYTKNLFPMLQPGASLYSRMTFGTDYVLVTGLAHMTFMENKLDDTFKTVQFLHRAVAFMAKVMCNGETVKVAKTPTDIYIETEDSYAFIRYDNKFPEYHTYLEMFKRDAFITVNRIFMKDILKRVSLVPEVVEVTIDKEKGKIYFENAKFYQELPLMDSHNLDAIDKPHFKIMPEVLSRVIVGNDSEFSESLQWYYIPQPNGTAIYLFEDDSKTWFSSISVKAY